MFTGIITHLAKIESVKTANSGDWLLIISLPIKSIDRSLKIGCSIACNGICLTLVEQKSIQEKALLSFEVSKETYEKTTFVHWQAEQIINLEFSLRAGDELGGHFVMGHVDCVGKIIEIKAVKGSKSFVFEAPKMMKKFLSPKGSVAINGASLTINEVKNSDPSKLIFEVNLINHTLSQTCFKYLRIGDLVNFEADLIARILWQQRKF